jgi:hypothetical protein
MTLLKYLHSVKLTMETLPKNLIFMFGWILNSHIFLSVKNTKITKTNVGPLTLTGKTFGYSRRIHKK